MKHSELWSKNRPIPLWTKLVAASLLSFALAGCGGGSDGAPGATGATGPAGPTGATGATGNDAVLKLNAAALTPAKWGELSLAGQVTSVDMSKGTPIVNFKVADSSGTPVVGLGQQDSAGAYSNFAFSIAKLIPADSTTKAPSRWVSYLVVSTPAAGKTAAIGFPEADRSGALQDNLDGSYTYTFALDISKAKSYVDGAVFDANHVKSDLDDMTYVPTMTHRLIVSVGGNLPGTTTAVRTSANLSYDFIPTTGKTVAATDPQRLIVDTGSCNSCHSKLSMHATFFPAIQDAKLCVVCHTEQQKYGSGETAPASGNVLVPAGDYAGYGATMKLQGRALPNFPNMAHKIHMGEELYYQGYNQFGVKYNDVTYPQDQRNCVKCHTASTTTPQGDNWKNVPSRLACGACHDSINFATGGGQTLSGSYPGHVGGAAADDSACTLCHDAASIASVYHVAVLPPNPNNIYTVPVTGNNNTNASYVATVKSNLPAGASQVTWDLKSVTLNASAQPMFTFRFLKDSVPVVFNTYSATGKTELMDNFVGGPSAYLAFAVPQDGITSPADWNATVSTYVKNVWRGTGKNEDGTNMAATAAGTLTFDAASGYYTLTLTGVKIPTTAKMMIGGIGYTYGLLTTQPLTQTNVAGYAYNSTTKVGGLSVPAPNVTTLVNGTLPSGFTTPAARRAIVETARCNTCHQALGVFTAKTFHAGQRNDAATCTFCHNVNRVNSGWGVNIKEAVHSLHAASKRSNKFSWEASAGDKYWQVTYPGVLNNCEQCHVAGSYDFSSAANAAAVPNLLWTTVATGTVPSPVKVVVTGNEAIPGTYWSPFVSAGAVYGTGFTTNFSSSSTTPYTDAAATTLVSSPITSACASCHDTAPAIAHMEGNGGHFYDTRTVAGNFQAQPEACLVCHGSGKVADIKSVHMK